MADELRNVYKPDDVGRRGFRYWASGAARWPMNSSPYHGREPLSVFCDITDLLVFARQFTAVTGIQRVTVEFVLSLGQTCLRSPVWTTFRGPDGTLAVCDADLVYEIASLMKNGETDRERLDLVIQRLDERLYTACIEPTDIWFCIGAFFALPNLAASVTLMKLKGVKVGAFIHDIIPYSNPEFCDLNTPVVFRGAVSDLSQIAEFVICNSAFTQREFAGFVQGLGAESIPSEVVKLGSDGALTSQSALRDVSSVPSQAPFVLCVGTIEARKNHIYLFRVWQQLAESLDGSLPTLVITGRKGWRVESFFYQLEATGHLGGRISVINDATDADLAHLYDGCLFTVFPSFVEGWGLPVGESLAHGKLCVASGTSSIPEVGGDLALYIDPLNVRDGVEVIGGLLRDPDRLAALTDRVRREFRPRSWAVFTTELLEAVERLSAAPARPFRPVGVRERTWLRFGRPQGAGETRGGGGAVNLAGACVWGWHGAEDWGRWVSGDEGRLVFEAPAAGRYVMVFAYRLPQGVGARAVRIVHDGEVRFEGVLGGPQGTVAIETPTAEDGRVEIAFQGRGAALVAPAGSKDGDARTVLLGLTRLFMYRTDTLEQRVMGMQDMQLQTLQSV